MLKFKTREFHPLFFIFLRIPETNIAFLIKLIMASCFSLSENLRLLYGYSKTPFSIISKETRIILAFYLVVLEIHRSVTVFGWFGWVNLSLFRLSTGFRQDEVIGRHRQEQRVQSLHG